MPHARSRFGTAGEDLAATYLEQKGYRILERNARTRVGELDLVCQLGRVLVFVEVKTRTSAAFGHPEESVTHAKQQHLVRAAHAYVSSHTAFRTTPFRIDVVAITMRPSGDPEILHIPNAVGTA
ncbi:MAG: YraN family protein [bacterium]|nr:YraN family protein [bacterium]